MEIKDLINKLKERSISIKLVNDQLEINAPTGQLTPELVAQLKLSKPDLIEYLKKLQHESFKSIIAMEEQEHYPVSNSQKRLWILDQFEEDLVAYNEQLVCSIEGDLDVDAFKKAFFTLVQRHEVLRTRFIDINGGPRQQVSSPENIDLEVEYLNLQHDDSPIDDFIQEDVRTKFDLRRDHLLRVKLIKSAENQFVFSLTIHHIIADVWSIRILSEEILKLYHSFAHGEKNPLNPLSIQYKDFTVWQNKQLSGERLKQHQDYWLNKFAGEIPVLEFPLDYSRPSFRTFNGDYFRFDLDDEIAKKLNQISKEHNASLFMILLATVKTLIYQYTGQNDIVIGSPIAGREQPELENQIGFYVNILALRTQFEGDKNFIDLLKRVKENALEAYKHQLYPFDKLVEDLQLGGNLSHSPLFDIAVALEDSNGNGLKKERREALKIKNYFSEVKKSKFDLTFTFIRQENTLNVSIEYNTDLFSPSTISRLAGHLKKIMNVICENPSTPLNQINYLSDKEINQILIDFNNTATPFSQDKLIHDFFERQVLNNPSKEAVTFGGEHLSYQELNEKANQLAHFLKSKGVGEGDFVGILLERSPSMIVSVLGVIKSGAAYVPFEVTFPEERIRTILNDLDVKVLLTQHAQSSLVRNIRWQLPLLHHIVYFDIEEPGLPIEALDTFGTKDFWNHISNVSVNRVTAGGFINSYTGKSFEAAEVDQYRDYVLSLMRPHLTKDKKVLEIGCGSGLIMFEASALVHCYVGLDPSETTQKKNRKKCREENLDNIILKTGFAHDLDFLEKNSLDLIVLASTVQFFPGESYLQSVIDQALELLVPGGVIVVADVMNIRKREAFKKSIEDYRSSYDLDYNHLKNNFDSELYLEPEIFEDIGSENPWIDSLTFYNREEIFSNELRFRFDVTIRKKASSRVNQRFCLPKRRGIWTNFHLKTQFKENLPPQGSSLSPAYAIFTSGSTGNPKGVLVNHRAVVNLIEWVNRTFSVNAQDKLLFVTSLCFDLSVYDIFGILSAGGTIEVASQEDILNPEKLLELLDNKLITFWDSAPAAFNRLVPYFTSNTGSSSLRLVFFSGDWIPLSLPKAVVSKYPSAEVISLGGATEATVWSNYFPVKDINPVWKSIPYGKPIQNSKYHILDSYLRLCPIGVPGDLYISGECLAQGYVNDPELTDQKFITKTFETGEVRKIYKTGDIARWFEDGNIEFLGRKDNQVKIRGFRIELGEIENTMLKFKGIKSVFVTTRNDKKGEKELIAYYVAEREFKIAQLREFISRYIPQYMVPSYFVHLTEFPLTNNGKIDRKSLPKPETSYHNQDKIDLPENEIERKLSLIWKEILDRDNIRLTDNFFEIGGHSLKATQILSRVNKEFNVRIEFRSFFSSPSIKGLAKLIEKSHKFYYDSINLLKNQEYYDISYSQKQLWILNQLNKDDASYNIPLSFLLEGELNISIFEKSFAQVIRRHESLRTTFALVEGEPKQKVNAFDPAKNKVEFLDLRFEKNKEQLAQLIANNESRQIFDLNAGPLIKAKLIQLTNEKFIFLLTVHHIVADGVSMDVFVKEFAESYNVFLEGKELSACSLKVQFKDYAAWYNQQLTGERFTKDRSFWLNQFEGEIPALKLLNDYPRPKIKTYNGSCLNFDFPSQLYKDLKRLESQNETSLYLTVLTLVKALLYKCSGQKDIIVGAPLDGRIHPDLQNQIGLYINTVPFRTFVDENYSFNDLLQNVKNTVFNAYEHQLYPFEFLINDLHINQPDRSPLFDVMVMVQNENLGGKANPLKNISVSNYILEHSNSKYDLTFVFRESDQRLIGSIEYNTDLFKLETIEKMMEDFFHITQLICSDDSLCLADISLTTSKEEEEELNDFLSSMYKLS